MRKVLLGLALLLFTANITAQPDERSKGKESSAAVKPPDGPPKTVNSHSSTNQTEAKPGAKSPKWYTSIEGAVGWFCGAVKHHWKEPDWWIVLITALTGYAIFRQAQEMSSATEVMEMQVFIPYRAYLVAGEVPNIEKSEAKFPIENHGQMAAKILSVDTELIIQDLKGHEEYRKNIITETIDTTVAYGKPAAFTVSVQLPRRPDPEHSFIVSIAIEYEFGVKPWSKKVSNKDTLKFARVYNGYKNQWVAAYESIDADFSQKDETGQGHHGPD